MMYQDIYKCICQNIENEDILSIMPNLQHSCCLKVDFQKVDQHAGGKWLIQDTKRRKDNQLQSLKLPCRISKLSCLMWHKGVRWHHVESDILKEGPGQKHPGRWEIAEYQIPCIKVLFKTNTKSHEDPSIRLFIREQDTMGKPKKTKSGIQPCNCALPRKSVLQNVMGCSFTNTEWHSCCMYIYVL